MQFRLGQWVVRPDMGSIVRDDQARHISPKAMDVLVCLARRPGRVVGKGELFEEVWKETFVSDDSLTHCVGELRRAFQNGTDEPPVIRTISKRGYLLQWAVVWEPDNGEAVHETPQAVAAATELRNQPALAPSGSGEADNVQAPSPQQPVWARRAIVASVGLVLLAAILLVFNTRRESKRTLSHSPRAIRSLAVLPLANLSSDPEQEYFADGMTDELITELAQLGAVDVISRTSVMRYKGTRQPLRDIAHDLSVDGVVEGTVLRSGARVRITVQLIDVATDTHLWSGSFEHDMSDVMSLQSGVARSIAQQLDLKLGPREQDRLRLTRKVVPEAYEAYLQGWYFFDRGQYAKAASLFEQSTAADPNFALAHALLFEADAMGSFIEDKPLSNRALKAMEKARELDDNLAEAHDAAGDLLLAGWNWQGAEVEYRRAIELDPGSIDAGLHYLFYLHEVTRWQEAEKQMERMLRLDPVSPAVNLEELRLLVDTHQHEAALKQFQRVLELDPNSAGAYYEIIPVYLALGREEDAISAFLKWQALTGTRPELVRVLAAAARQGGFRGCIRKQIEQLRTQAKKEHVSPLMFAYAYARLGDKDATFKYLDEAYRQRSGRLIWIKARAVWDPLRSDPRYQSLLRRMRFPE